MLRDQLVVAGETKVLLFALSGDYRSLLKGLKLGLMFYLSFNACFCWVGI